MTARRLSELTNEFTVPLPAALRFYGENGSVSGFATAATLRSNSTSHQLEIADFASAKTSGVLSDGSDDTPAFLAAEAALPATGGDIHLDAGALYLINWVVTKPNVHLAGQYGAGNGNVTVGFAPFDVNGPAITIGDGVTQLNSFSASQIRVYSQTGTKGFLINGAAYVRLFDCEFGGFTDYAFGVTSPGGAASFFVQCVGCTFFATANTTGAVIDLTYGGSFDAAIFFTACEVDSSPAAVNCKAIIVRDQVDVWLSQTWFSLQSNKGLKAEGTGRFHCANVMLDSPLPSDILVEWPSEESYPNSYFTGDMKVDGFGRNSANVLVDLKGIFGGGRGFSYGDTSYRPRIIGDWEQIPTDGSLTGPLASVSGGQPPLADTSYPAGSIFRSKNNSGTSNTLFVKSLDTDFENVITGDYVGKTADANIDSDATTSIGEALGDFVFVTGTTTITSFGTASRNGIKRRVFFTGALTITHNDTSLYMPGQTNYTTIGGDVLTFLYMGSGNWRCVDFHNVYGVPARPSRRAELEHTASFSFQYGDDRYWIKANHASVAIQATVPPDVYSVGTELVMEQYGAAAASFLAGAGVTINKMTGKTLTAAAQHGVIRCRLTSTANTWIAYGDLGV